MHVSRLLVVVIDLLLGGVVGGDVGPPLCASTADTPWVLTSVIGVVPNAAVVRRARTNRAPEGVPLVVELRELESVGAVDAAAALIDGLVVAVVAACCASVRFAAVAPRCTSVRLAGLRVHLPPSSASRETRGGR